MAIAFVELFRVVSDAEWQDIQGTGGFRPVPASMEGKWFAESEADARQWGRRLYTDAGQPCVLVKVVVPVPQANTLLRLGWLDNIGPARFAEDSDLVIINQTKLGPVIEVAAILPGVP
jgi:hypothetical protein